VVDEDVDWIHVVEFRGWWQLVGLW